jgi:hypothetical protein
MASDSVTKAIIGKIEEANPGTIFFPADFLDLGNPEGIHTTLSRIVATNTLLRLAKGIYLKPKMDSELGMLKPSMEELAHKIADRDKVVIRPTGTYALNKLGLSTQIPTKVVFLTNGNPKRIQVGKSTIVFQKTTPKQLAIQPENIFLAIQALIALKDQADDPNVMQRLTEVLAREKSTDIRKAVPLAPQRVAKLLRQISERIETKQP